MNLHEFYNKAEEIRQEGANHGVLRKGQALFVALDKFRPDLLNQVYLTDKDPYYAKDDDETMMKFHEFIATNW